MLIVVFRALFLYAILLISMRIMGKGELGELQPFDFVISLMIAELAAIPMEDLSAPLSHGVMAIATLVFLQCLTSYVSLKSNKIRKLISGKPTILFEHGEFKVKEMEKLRININDVLGQMRLKGYYDVQDVDYVIIETNGEMSILGETEEPKSRCKRIPIAVIMDREVIYENLKNVNITYEKLKKEINKSGLKINQILYGFIDENNNFKFYKR